jgi:hypothetical protein
MVPSHCFETASTFGLKCGNTAKISAVLFKLTCTFSDLMCLCVPELSTICIPNLQDYHTSEKWQFRQVIVSASSTALESNYRQMQVGMYHAPERRDFENDLL